MFFAETKKSGNNTIKKNAYKYVMNIRREAMNCPYCNAEMTKGVLRSGYPIIWFDGDEDDWSVSFGKSGETYDGHKWHRISHGFLRRSFVDSYRCENCKMIISKE